MLDEQIGGLRSITEARAMRHEFRALDKHARSLHTLTQQWMTGIKRSGNSRNQNRALTIRNRRDET